MTALTPQQSITELMQLALSDKNGQLNLSDVDRELLVAMLKQKAFDELDYGQEVVLETIKVVKRVTGNVSVFFGKI